MAAVNGSHPFLVFRDPQPTSCATRRGVQQIKEFPSPARQKKRIIPKLRELLSALEQQRIGLHEALPDANPEKVLVLETIGDPGRFLEAAACVRGLELLGGVEFEENVLPAHGFVVDGGTDRGIRGQFYLASTDSSALETIIDCFNKWEGGSQSLPSPLRPLSNLFKHIHDVRTWNVNDRLREDELEKDWEDRRTRGEKTLPFEVELWYFHRPEKKQEVLSKFENLLREYGGKVLDVTELQEIEYHGVVGEVPTRNFPRYSDLKSSGLARHDGVMFIGPVAQCQFRTGEEEAEAGRVSKGKDEQKPTGEPVLALLDGVPLQNHDLLAERLEILDPDDFQQEYEPARRFHGTAMASMVCHGDLHTQGVPLSRRLVVRPILRPSSRTLDEIIPEEHTIVDQVHRAVKDIVENKQSVQVVNLSVGDIGQQISRKISPWARLLDWLSWKHNLLFLVSSGNPRNPIPSISIQNANSLVTEDALLAEAVNAMQGQPRRWRLLSPAESLNSVTVGAIHEDGSGYDYTVARQVDPFQGMRFPSIYGGHGPGHLRSIKPDILLPGGRMLFQEETRNKFISVKNSRVGQKFACPSSVRGNLSSEACDCGTSYATALASRYACILYDELERMRDRGRNAIPQAHFPVLLKALLVHGSGRREHERGKFDFDFLKAELSARAGLNPGKKWVQNILGYGELDASRVMGCTDQRVTALGQGLINDGEGQAYFLPFPPEISVIHTKVRLVVTLAWITPIHPRSQKYRVAHLWFETPEGEDLVFARNRSDMHAVRRGTVQHEIFSLKKAPALRPGGGVSIQVNCKSHAAALRDPVRYALVSTLEIVEEDSIDIFSPIQRVLAVPLGT